MRRLVGVLAGVALAAGATLVPMVPAGAAYQVNVDGVATCNPVTGQYDLVWSAHNSIEGPVTIVSAVMTPPGTDIVGAFSPKTIPGMEKAQAFVSLPGTTIAIVSIDVQLNEGTANEASVLLNGTCTATAALQVTRSVAVVGETVTISGTGCILVLDETNGNNAVSIPGVVTGTVAFTPPLPFGPVNAAADGTWSTTIVVPPGTPPGTYAVNATCTLPARAVVDVSAQAVGTFQYAPGTLTITIPAAIAIPAAPKFTG